MTESKATKAQNLARIRDNQRRSRARRKEYLHELEAKLRTCEQTGIEASTEIQNAARRVLDENRKLRALLRERGVTDTEIAAVTGQVDSTHTSSAPVLSAMLERKIVCGGVPASTACPTSSPSDSSPVSTSAMLPTTTVAPIAIPARRTAPLSEYGSQSPMSITSSVETPPNFNSTPYHPVAMTPTPEIKSEAMTPFAYSFEQLPASAWSFQNDMNYAPDSMTYYSTPSCMDAATIIKNMTVDVGSDLGSDLSYRNLNQDCYVDNSLVFNMMEKYATPITGIM